MAAGLISEVVRRVAPIVAARFPSKDAIFLSTYFYKGK